MNEPVIHCPNCRSEIKLTESLAAPLIEQTRRQFERTLAAKDAEVAKRETALKTREGELAAAKASIDEQVAAKVKAERSAIAAEEAKKAKLLAASDLDQKAKELSELQEVLKERDAKLADAQKAQAELLRKQRELDDARREMDLTIEKKVQESLAAVRDKAKQEVDEGTQAARAGEGGADVLHAAADRGSQAQGRAGLSAVAGRGSGARA
jgi:hypothetical protein